MFVVCSNDRYLVCEKKKEFLDQIKFLFNIHAAVRPLLKGRSRLDMVVELRVKYCGEIALKIEFALLLNNYTPKKRLKCVLKISSQYCTLSSTAVCYVKPVAFLLSGFIRIISF